jgi:hypothetical protein
MWSSGDAAFIYIFIIIFSQIEDKIYRFSIANNKEFKIKIIKTNNLFQMGPSMSRAS